VFSSFKLWGLAPVVLLDLQVAISICVRFEVGIPVSPYVSQPETLRLDW
jgi:hypothetical protein